MSVGLSEVHFLREHGIDESWEAPGGRAACLSSHHKSHQGADIDGERAPCKFAVPAGLPRSSCKLTLLLPTISTDLE